MSHGDAHTGLSLILDVLFCIGNIDFHGTVNSGILGRRINGRGHFPPGSIIYFSHDGLNIAHFPKR